MIRPPWKNCEGTEMVSLPDLSMQNGRSASHHPMRKFATMGLLVRQNSEKKESRVRQTIHNPESLTQRFS